MNCMKRNFFITGFLVSVTFFVPPQTFAQTPSLRPIKIERLTDLHTRCDTEIDRRVTTLGSLSGRISQLKKLSDSQKSQFQAQIQTATSGLTSLKSQCDADTEVGALREHLATIFTLYRIYAVQTPQIHLLAAADVMDVATDRLTDLANSLQLRVDQSGNSNTLSSILADMRTKIADAGAQYDSVQSTIPSLTPAGYNANKSDTEETIQAARTAIKTGAQDLKSALQDAHQIRQSLKAPAASPTQIP